MKMYVCIKTHNTKVLRFAVNQKLKTLFSCKNMKNGKGKLIPLGVAISDIHKKRSVQKQIPLKKTLFFFCLIS